MDFFRLILVLYFEVVLFSSAAILKLNVLPGGAKGKHR